MPNQREQELEDLLSSARAIAARKGKETAWDRFDIRLRESGISAVTAKTFRVLPSDEQKTEGTYFKEEVEAIIARYGTLSAYETLGALEVVKQNLLERLSLVK